MSTLEMDPDFCEALRTALVETVESSARARRRWRWRVGSGMFVGLTLVAGGVAVATGLFSLPGAPVDTTLGNIVTATRTGSATINIGVPPAGANDLSLTLTCLTPGKFNFPNGSSETCDAADVGQRARLSQASEVVPITPGADSVSIDASPNASWTLQAMYVNRVTTSWGTNANGQTYGVANQNGTPNLIAVAINQGRTQGYVKASDLNCASGGDPSSPAQALAWQQQNANRNITIPAYESDGTTIIGEFVLGDATGSDAETVPLSSLSRNC